MKTRIYVAGGSTERLTVVRPMLERLRAAGFVITHDWTQCEGYDRQSTESERQKWARQDLDGVVMADIVWCMVPEIPSTGMAVEMGMALFAESALFVSGKRNKCIFYELCNCYDTHDEAFDAIVELAEETADVL